MLAAGDPAKPDQAVTTGGDLKGLTQIKTELKHYLNADDDTKEAITDKEIAEIVKNKVPDDNGDTAKKILHYLMDRLRTKDKIIVAVNNEFNNKLYDNYDDTKYVPLYKETTEYDTDLQLNKA